MLGEAETREQSRDNSSSKAGSLLEKIDSRVNTLVESQEKMRYGLLGYSKSLGDITNNLNKALAGNWLVKQSRVYDNINNLLTSGIVYNVEQRAFLQTLAEDMGAKFRADSTALTRLVNLQRTDSSENRLALEVALKEFLNQNFENSQYIVNSFQQVSSALIEAQSLMTSQNAVALESTVQKWLGSLESVGMANETITNLASAIGKLGSGDISGLSSGGISNLIMMGASQAGLSYADLLTRGVTGEDADKLIKGIVNYIISMGDQSSNVVKSEYAKIFGINVSDIVAARNLTTDGAIEAINNSKISTDINKLLNMYSELVPITTKISNFGDNLIYGTAADIANNNYLFYKAMNLLGDVGTELLDGTQFLGFNIGSVAKLLPYLSVAPSLLKEGVNAIGNAGSSILNTIFGGSSGVISRVKAIKTLFTGGGAQDLISSISESLDFATYGANMMTSMYEELSGFTAEAQKIISSGSGLSGIGAAAQGAIDTTSETYYINNQTDSSEINYYNDNHTETYADKNRERTEVVKEDLSASLVASLGEATAEEIQALEEAYIDPQDFYRKVQEFLDNTAIPFSENNLTIKWVTEELAKQLADSQLAASNNIKNFVELMYTEFPVTNWSTYTELIEGGNTVTIGTNDNTTYIRDMLTITAVNTENIFLLLSAWLSGNSQVGAVDIFAGDNNPLTSYYDSWGFNTNAAGGGV